MRLVRLLEAMELKRPVEVVVGLYRRKRSTNQNSLYWAWLGILSQETGYTSDELHELFKRMYLPPVTLEIGTYTVDVPRSTTGLNTLEFSDYMRHIEVFAATELGVALPQPDDERWVA